MGWLDAAPTAQDYRSLYADRAKQNEFDRMAKAYSQYRLEAQQAHRNALQNKLSVYQGAQNALGGMTGGRGGVNTANTAVDPFGPNMLGQGGQRGTSFWSDEGRFGSVQQMGVPQPGAAPYAPGPIQGNAPTIGSWGPGGPPMSVPGSAGLPPGPNLNMGLVMGPRAGGTPGAAPTPGPAPAPQGQPYKSGRR